jgi:small redox-active disulfide protein 2
VTEAKVTAVKVTVFGPGCRSCRLTEQTVRDAARGAGVAVEIDQISDFRTMADAGINATPAVVIEGEIKVSGRKPKPEEAAAWFRDMRAVDATLSRP